jgi:EAL and modified HD-GYP domain-containing signal transduction protein
MDFADMRLVLRVSAAASLCREAWYISGVSASPQPVSVSPGEPSGPSNTGVQSSVRYIARQPILNREQNTHGYELLFRSGPENCFLNTDADMATVSTIDFSLLAVSSALTAGLPAFINCTHNILAQDLITLLPRDRVVVEVLEDVIADEEIIGACDRLRRAGYLIALDDYVPCADTMRLLPFADIVKVDFLATNAARQAAIAADMRRRGIRLLAEKIETREQFDLASQLGYHYFQGYFFCKPQMLTMQDIPCSKLAYIQVLSVANRDYYDVDELERVILREPSLCYRLLRYLNSAAFGLFPIRSIRHALSLLGQREIQKWVSIVVVIAVAGDRPTELIASTLTRARTCETLSRFCGVDSSAAFMVGVMSLMDAILDRPMDTVISQLPLTSECKDALRGSTTALGRLLQLATSCERGQWEEVASSASQLGLHEDKIWDAFRDACRWSGDILRQNNEKKQ